MRKLQIDGYIAERAFNRPLLIEYDKGKVIANYLEQRLINPSAVSVERDDGLPDEDESQIQILDGLAIIPILGTLVHRGDFMQAMSGLVSYRILRAQIIEAAENPLVHSILLDIDSGGGEVEGNFELSRLIRKINDEVKPVIAISNGSAYSGAFSIGVSAGAFFVTETGGVGSVGVIIQHIDYTEANKAQGIKVTQVTCGDRKGELSPDVALSKSAYKLLKDEVDRVGDIFINHVALMRNISKKSVKDTEATLLFGQDAVNIGFVDGIIPFDSLIEILTNGDLPTDPTQRKMRIEDMFQKMKVKASSKKSKRAEEDEDEEPKVKRSKRTEKDDEHKPQSKKRSKRIEEDDEDFESEEDDEDFESEEDDEDFESEEDDEDFDAEEDDEDFDAEEDDEDFDAEEEDEDKPQSKRTKMAKKASKIVSICVAAGQPKMAASFIRKGASVKEVRRKMGAISQIKKACALAGKPSRAAGFIRSGASLKEVQNTLIREMANGQGAVSSRESPSTIKNAMRSKRNVILADIEKRKQAMEAKGAK